MNAVCYGIDTSYYSPQYLWSKLVASLYMNAVSYGIYTSYYSPQYLWLRTSIDKTIALLSIEVARAISRVEKGVERAWRSLLSRWRGAGDPLSVAWSLERGWISFVSSLVVGEGLKILRQ